MVWKPTGGGGGEILLSITTMSTLHALDKDTGQSLRTFTSLEHQGSESISFSAGDEPEQSRSIDQSSTVNNE